MGTVVFFSPRRRTTAELAAKAVDKIEAKTTHLNDPSDAEINDVIRLHSDLETLITRAIDVSNRYGRRQQIGQHLIEAHARFIRTAKD